MGFLEGEKLKKRMQGRIPLSGSIRLQYVTSDRDRVGVDFLIKGVVNAGGSCICYSAEKILANGMRKQGILKEFYPMDMDDGSRDKGAHAFHLKRYDIDERLVANQLYSGESTKAKFEEARKEFCESHYKVLELIENSSCSDSYFQNFEIYQGISKDDDSNHTVYIWTSGDRSLVSFEDHLNDMYKRVAHEIDSPGGNLNLYLANELHFILQAVRALAKGILIIHEKFMLHLDIKPSNFGVRDLGDKSGDNVSVAMFDINSLHSRAGAGEIRFMGTKYFAAPELTGDIATMKVGCKTDIFSLGATLYNSIVLGKDGRGLYEVKNFGEITGRLRHSWLFEYSEYTSGVEIADGIVNILKRSLARCPRDYAHGLTNFESVDEFIDAIEAVDEKVKNIIAIGKAEAATGKKAIVKMADKEEYYGKEIEKIGGAISAMQCLLYDRPLYDYVQDGKLNVLVLGAGVFGQKFLDIALEMSQIKGCYLNVVVASKDKESDERRYLESRPEIRNYFWVNGEKPAYLGKYGSSVYCDYGRVSFVQIRSELAADSEDNIAILKETLGSDEKFGYVFVSLSDERLNRRIASDLTKTGLLKSKKSVVNFVTYKNMGQENARNKKAVGDVINPVHITQSLIARHRDCNFLHDAGFNCYILRKNNLSLDMNCAREAFMNPYNYTASMSMAISLKYKLHSIGLSLEEVRAETVADRRKKMLELSCAYREKTGISAAARTEEQQKCLDELTMYEHARWNVNMICSSYRLLPEEEFKHLNSGSKNKAERKHVRIVPGGNEWALGGEEWTESLSAWDYPDDSALGNLDPLDRMSVQLHRHYMAKAVAFDMHALKKEAEILRKYIGANHGLLVAFNSCMVAMNAVKTRKTKRSNVIKNLSHCETVFLNKLEAINPPGKEDIKKKFNEICELFAPVKEAYSYTDYKEVDYRILASLPFILNYTARQRICMPLIVDETENRWFDNVASALVINPEKVTYIVCADGGSDIVTPSMLKVMSHITKLMDNRNLQTGINFIFYVDMSDKPLSNDACAQAKAALGAVSPRIDRVDFVELNERSDLSQKIANTFIANQDSPLRFSAVELGSDEISDAVSSALKEVDIPSYKFDSVAMQFCAMNTNGYCRYNDIPFDIHLNVEDAFIAHDRPGVYCEPELHNDYYDIWDSCCCQYRMTESWNTLCKAIGDKVNVSDKLFSLLINENKSAVRATAVTEHFLPGFCRASVKKILAFLSDEAIGMVDSWEIKDHNSTMFRVKFTSDVAVKNAFVRLLSKNIYALADESKIRTVRIKNSVQISVDSLVVENFNFDISVWNALGTTAGEADDKQRELYGNVRNIFSYLIEKGYIVDMSETPYNSIGNGAPLSGICFDFCFASESVKSLLSTEGQLAELYTYYKIKESSFCDDAGISVEVQCHKNNGDEYVATQGFDIVAIKDFSMQLIEVKCCNRLITDFYAKLRDVGNRFGINKKLVLIALVGDSYRDADNEAVIKHGEAAYGVKTVICRDCQLDEAVSQIIDEAD
ncbi:MAG: hypothetical protein IIW48_01490 [Clostridia bacterium]|nr:hypothetical protein [Clostridia bacterium]